MLNNARYFILLRCFVLSQTCQALGSDVLNLISAKQGQMTRPELWILAEHPLICYTLDYLITI